MKELVLAAVQMESPFGSISKNAERICDWASRAVREGADLVFFPECSLTGYGSAHADKVAVPIDDTSVAQIEKHAAALGVTIGFGFIEQASLEAEASCSNGSQNARSFEKPYNTYVVTSGDERLVYRKTHLGQREQQAFTAGNNLPVACIGGVNIGVQLCWEAHIPDITTTLRAKGAELVLMPHAVGMDVARRAELWSRYLPARAYDNGLFVVACNALRRNREGVVVGGGIAVYGPDGVCCVSSESGEEGMLLVRAGGALPRDAFDTEMRGTSYYDRRRSELYSI